MKRCITLLLVVALLIPCLIVPASATGAYDSAIHDYVSDIWLNTESIYFYFYGESGEVAYDHLGNEVQLTPFQFDLYELKFLILGFLDDWWIGDFYDYFFTKNTTYSVPILMLSNSSLGVRYTTARGTGFQADLNQISSDLLVGPLNALSGIYNNLVSSNNYLATLVDKLTELYNYFCVEDTTFTYNTYGFGSDGMWTVTSASGTWTSFRVDIHQTFQRFYDLIYDLLAGNTHGSDRFDADMEPIETQVDEWLDGMETAPTINLDDVDAILSNDITADFDDDYVSAMKRLMSLDLLMMIMLPIFILCMVGYVLYGRR